MSKLNDLIPAEREHTELVQHLGHLYATRAQDVQDLDAIHTQLHQEFTLPVSLAEVSTSHVSSMSRAESRRQGISTFPTPRKTRWARQFALLAAVVVMTLVTGTFVSLLYLSHQHNTTTGSRGVSTPTVVPPINNVEPSISAYMIDANVGWLRDAEGNVKRTTNSGKTWQDVTPPSTLLPDKKLGRLFYVISASNASLINNDQKSSTVISTIDGGQHWQKRSPMLSDGTSIAPTNISFFNSQEGWGLLPSNTTKAPGLISTHDGGQTWSVTGSLPSDNGSFYADVAGNSFLNFTSATYGWYVINAVGQGNGNVYQKPKVYYTHDAGQTWHLVTFPASFASQTIDTVYAPLFFNANDGVIVDESINTLVDHTSEHSITMYVTHNGGTTWVATKSVKGYEWSIQDANHWWVLEDIESFNSTTQQGANQITIHSTSDAGQHWLASAQPQFTSMFLVPCSTNQCGSDKTSWATGYINNSKQSHLYKTIDGGKTWFLID